MSRRLAISICAVLAVTSGCAAPLDHESHMSAPGQSAGMSHEHSASAAMGSGKPTDPMFTAQMIPHHQAAIDMAALARTRAEHPEIRRLAADISRAQAAEIALMTRVGRANGWEPNAKMDHSSGDGMSKHDMGMDMDPAELRTAKPFDKAFIEMMVPHHLGAVRMANHELERGSNGEIRNLAKSIIDSQSAQIDQMKRWYRSWYGAPLR